MATIDPRNVLRSLPALFALLAALFLAPQAPADGVGADAAPLTHSAAEAPGAAPAPAAAAGSHARPLTHSALVQAGAPAVETSEASSTLDDELGAVVTDRTHALRAQRVTGSAGSRAPPAAL